MKKKTRIQSIEITDKREVFAFDTEGVRVKLTRQQRNLFSEYKNPNFLEDVFREFGADVLAPDFYITKHGDMVYTRN
jgi:hypothetical protein